MTEAEKGGQFECVICHFVFDLDDVVFRGPGDQCVCVGCQARKTHTEHPMPKGLREEVERIVNSA